MSEAKSSDKQTRIVRLGIEDNGYLHRFFTLMNSAKNTFETSCVKVQIPETIVLNMGIIVGWFFTSKKDGTVRRKKRANTTKENVAAMLHANFKKNDKKPGFSKTSVPVATVTYNATDAEGQKIQNVKYLMDGEVDDFLKNTPLKNCLLQQWIHPCGNHNSVLHCLWTPSGVQISRRNARNLLDDRAPAAYRLATYESGAILPSDFSICTSTTKQIIKNTCDHIAEHLSTVTAPPLSMTTYWKISSDLHVVLLWCSQLTKIGERKSGLTGPSLSPTISLSIPQTETQIGIPICPFCKNIAGIEGSSTSRRAASQNAEPAMFGDHEIKSISYDAIYHFCLNRERKGRGTNSNVSKTSNHQWKVIPCEFRSLQPDFDLKRFNSESSKLEFRQKSVSVCDRCYNKFTQYESEIRVVETQSKLHDFGDPSFAILPPTFCSSYTIEAYEKHFERLRGSDPTNPKIKLAIKELSRVWDDDTDDIWPVDYSIQNKLLELSTQVPPPIPPPIFRKKSQILAVVNENVDGIFSSNQQTYSMDFAIGTDANAEKKAKETDSESSRPDDDILKSLQKKATWRQGVGTSFRYNIFDSIPELRTIFKETVASCKRTTNEQRLRGFSLSMSEWLSFCKYRDVCELMPLKTSHCIAAFIHANKWSLDPDENQMNCDEFGSAFIFLAAKANVLVIDEHQSIPDCKSCSGVVLAGVKRFLAGLGAHEWSKGSSKKMDFKIRHQNAKNYAEVAELDFMFDASNYDEDLYSTFKLWEVIPTIPRMFERVARSDGSTIANMGARSTTVSMQEWMKMCDDLAVVKYLPLKRSDCVVACIDAVKGNKASPAHQEMNVEQFSQAMIHLAVESGIWGDMEGSKPSASSCSGQIVRGVALMLKELLSESPLELSDSTTVQDDPLQRHALHRSAEGAVLKSRIKPTKSVVITAPMWRDIPLLVPYFEKVCRLSTGGIRSVGKRTRTVSMAEWLQMCDECSLTKLLPISRADCISGFLYANACIISDSDTHELNLIEFCQSLIFLAAKSGILGDVDLSNLPSAGSCTDEVSRGVLLFLKEARIDEYVGTRLDIEDNFLSGTFNQERIFSNCGDKMDKPPPGSTNNAVAITGRENGIAVNDEHSCNDENDDGDDDDDDISDGSDIDDADDHFVGGTNSKQVDSNALHHAAEIEGDTKCYTDEEEVMIDDDDDETLSCDTTDQNFVSDSFAKETATLHSRGGHLVENAPLWVIEPSIRNLFDRYSGGSNRLPIDKLLQHSNDCNLLKSLRLSRSQFLGAFAKSNLGFDADEDLNSNSLSLKEFCQGLIIISCKTSGSLCSVTNFPNATSCPNSVARSVTDILKRTNMLKPEDLGGNPRLKQNFAVPKLQIPANISSWLSSESAAIHTKKLSPLFVSQHAVAPKQKTTAELYAGASSAETNRLKRRHEAQLGSQSARPAPAPPIQAKKESHGARTARYVRKI